MTVRTAETPYVCGWTIEDDCGAPSLKAAFEDPAKTAMAQRCLDTAAEILYALSGRQFGVCEVTVRPCRKDCESYVTSGSGPRWTPVLQGGQWTNVSCGACNHGCSCTQVCEVSLPGPVYDIREVLLDGAILPPEEYRVDNGNSLVRLTDECWPLCQDMVKDCDEVGTWCVTYGRGRELPAAGMSALLELASELCKACLCDISCKLPARVTSVSRQGITMAMLDPMTFIEKGRTGLYLVDLWLRSVNPKARPRSGGILSPDMIPPRQTTWGV